MCQKESWGAIFATTEAHSTQRDQPPRMHGSGLWMYEQKEQRVTPVPCQATSWKVTILNFFFQIVPSFRRHKFPSRSVSHGPDSVRRLREALQHYLNVSFFCTSDALLFVCIHYTCFVIIIIIINPFITKTNIMHKTSKVSTFPSYPSSMSIAGFTKEPLKATALKRYIGMERR